MLIYSMSVSVDGFIADREGAFEWTPPSADVWCAIPMDAVERAGEDDHPVVVGGGTPFLPPVTDDIALDLIETRTFGSRVIYERYGRARDGSE